MAAQHHVSGANVQSSKPYRKGSPDPASDEWAALGAAAAVASANSNAIATFLATCATVKK
jgi:hypothetical protein